MNATPIRILLFEDNPTDVLLLRERLSEPSPFTFTLEHVSRLRDGLERLAKEPVDVALVDLGLPDSQGLDTCRAVLASGAALAVVVLTALDDEEVGVEAVHEGAQDFLVKRQIHGGTLTRVLRYAVERARSEAQLKQARDLALEASRLKSAFIANVSHELRTPLNIITGFSCLIEERAKQIGDGEILGFLPALTRASERLIGTVGGILDLSKIEAGSFTVNRRMLDVAALAGALVEDFRPIAAAKSLDVSLDLRAADAVVSFDEYCLSHALSNLLENAIKFTERGGIRVTIDREPDGRLVLEVADSGIGMEGAFLGKLFEPFVQEDVGASRRFEGSGLGLALTRRFVEMNGASIRADSEKGRGSRFRIRFARNVSAPADAVGAAEEPEDGNVPAGTHGAPGEERRGVLVVEDDPDNQHLLRCLLRSRFDVFVAASGAEMLEQLRLHGTRIRLLLMDVSLRGSENGLDLTRALHDDARWRDVPVVAVTAHALEEDRRRALAAGCRAFVPKPIRPRQLLALAERITAVRASA
jgi:two-component system, sensor histidine kinase